MEITRQIILDINNDIYTKIEAKQNDVNSRYIEFTLTNNGVALDLTGHTVKIFAIKSDNTLIFNNVEITSATDGKVLIELTSQALAVSGDLTCELVVYGVDSSVLSSKVFTINVLTSIRNDSAVESTNEFTALTEGMAKLASLDMKLAGKANQSDLTAGLDSKRDKITPIVMADLATEVKSAFTGGAVATVGENAVGRENLKDLSVYPEKISTDSSRINLLDLSAVLSNSIFNATNGQIIPFNTLSVSGFIATANGKQYTIPNGQQTNLIALYDANQAFLGVINGNTSSTTPFTFVINNVNAKYFRINMQDAKYPISQFMVVEGATLPSSYVSYSTKKTYAFPWLRMNKEQISNFSVNASEVNECVVYPINIYNKYMSTDGQIFNASTGAPMSFGNFTLSDFMQVQVNASYTINRGDTANLAAMYDVNKNFLGVISGTANGTTGSFTFTITNASCVYIRLNIDITKNDKNTFMVVKGTTLPSTYYAYGNTGFELSGLKVLNSNIVHSKWLNKKVYLFGDSITYWDARYAWFDSSYYMVGYPTYIRNELGATTINKGSAGATLSTQETNNIHNIITSTSLTDAYACTITGGTNDISHNVPIGTLGGRNDTTFDTTTYIGALRNAIHYCYSQNPKIKIYLLAPINMTSTVVTAYCDAMESVANMYSIPILRMDKTVQINPRNASTLLVDGVHPNNDGFKIMADVMIPFLKNN